MAFVLYTQHYIGEPSFEKRDVPIDSCLELTALKEIYSTALIYNIKTHTHALICFINK